MVTDCSVKIQAAMSQDLNFRKKLESGFVGKAITDWKLQLMA